MPRVQINARGEEELRNRIRRAARLADLSTNEWILRALEAALSEAKGPLPAVQAGPGPVPSENPRNGIASEGARPAASPRAPGDPAAKKAEREAPPDRRVKSSAQARQGVRPIPKAPKR